MFLMFRWSLTMLIIFIGRGTTAPSFSDLQVSTNPDSTPLGVHDCIDSVNLIYISYSWLRIPPLLESDDLKFEIKFNPSGSLSCSAPAIVPEPGLLEANTSDNNQNNSQSSTKSAHTSTQDLETSLGLIALTQAAPAPVETMVATSLSKLTIWTSVEPKPKLSTAVVAPVSQPSSGVGTHQVLTSVTSTLLGITESSDSGMGPDKHSTVIGATQTTSSSISRLGDTPVLVLSTSSSTPTASSSTVTSSIPSLDAVLTSLTTLKSETSLVSISNPSDSVEITPAPTSEVPDADSSNASLFGSTDALQPYSLEPTTSTVDAPGSTTPVDSSEIDRSSSSTPNKLAAIIVPIFLVVLLILGALVWWLIKRRKEKNRIDRLASKAVWMDQGYVDSIRQRMMGMDEEKVNNTGIPKSLTESRDSAAGPLPLIGTGTNLSIFGFSEPTLRRSTKRVCRSDIPNVKPTTDTAGARDIEETARVHNALALNEDDCSQSLKDHLQEVTAAAINFKHNETEQATKYLISPCSSPTTSDNEDEALTQPQAVTSPDTTPLHETATSTRSDSVASKLSRRLERAVRRRSGMEELHD